MKTESLIMKPDQADTTRKIKAFIAEDEPESMFMMTKMIERYCTDVDLVASAGNIKDSIERIKTHKPSLLFLDINLTDGDSFEILNHIDYNDYEIIFITAYTDKVIKAFKFSALHYLIKPIEKEGLIDAVSRYKRLIGFENKSDRIDVFKEKLVDIDKRIALQIHGGFCMANISDIMYCESSCNYTIVHLKKDNTEPDIKKDSYIITKPLSFYESLLTEYDFFRIHNKYLINMKELALVHRTDWTVTLKNGKVLSVAERRRPEFLERIKGIDGL